MGWKKLNRVGDGRAEMVFGIHKCIGWRKVNMKGMGLMMMELK